MRRKTLKFLALLLSVIIVLGFAAVALPAHGQTEAKLFVEPQNNIFDTSVKTVGDTIIINVTVANITGLFGGIQTQLGSNTAKRRKYGRCPIRNTHASG